ncbi:MAG: nitroreductase family deazaflavin-dependent oxidoreductase [Chloroflexi bacterium]|nr:nitroreductase family deazaflavin-dependent oxidoreductase [Chloroflexota bacterium]
MAGKMNKPNALQRLIHRIVMWKPVTAFFATRLHRIDKFILKLSGNRFTVSQLAGWTIIQLTTIGAKSKLPRTLPLIGVLDGGKIALIASSFGREHNPGWYYNLKAHPECEILLKGRSGKYIARETDGEERERLWRMAVSYYAGYEKYKQRAAPRRIPVMLLEPKK